MSLESFTKQYLITALWSSVDDNGEPLDTDYTINDISAETHSKMLADCKAFYNENCLLWDDDETAGHDFWLTRNHHGCGFSDGDYPDNGDLLTEKSHLYGEYNLYIGDDSQIYGT
jgi:hypothetical protein